MISQGENGDLSVPAVTLDELWSLPGLTRLHFAKNASSSEMVGKVRETPQRETTAFYPSSPYGVAKTFGHYITVNPESYGAFVCPGVLFNQESPHRRHEFVTRKATRAVARISLGLQDTVALGNLDTRRDWGFAADYVDAMWQMLQQPEPDDWAPLVVQDPRFFRPAEVDLLIGDATNARETLGWEPRVGFEKLIETMVDAGLAPA